ncbi:MAG: ABC transporter permease [bacterium]
MFIHHYLYRLKCIIRNKETMFWSFLFPIILATLFNLAFSNITSVESFNPINLGIVDNAEYQENTVFIKAIGSVSSPDQVTGGSELFNINLISREEADKLLNENKIEGYIYHNNGMKLVVKESGIYQTIIKSFLDDYKQTFSTIETISNNNPDALQHSLLASSYIRNNYLEEVVVSKSAPNLIVIYFYALIGMACLYGCYIGLEEVVDLQANLSPKGARVSVAPTHKLKTVIASISAAITVQLSNIFILLAYLILVLKVDFGSQLGYIAITCIIGSITGVTFGTSVASVLKLKEGIKIGILTGSTLVMAFFAGLMYDGIKHLIRTNIPILAYLNPVNLIADSLYALYYYDTYTRFFTDVSILSVFAVLFSVITYLALRRQKYASI